MARLSATLSWPYSPLPLVFRFHPSASISLYSTRKIHLLVATKIKIEPAPDLMTFSFRSARAARVACAACERSAARPRCAPWVHGRSWRACSSVLSQPKGMAPNSLHCRCRQQVRSVQHLTVGLALRCLHVPEVHVRAAVPRCSVVPRVKHHYPRGAVAAAGVTRVVDHASLPLCRTHPAQILARADVVAQKARPSLKLVPGACMRLEPTRSGAHPVAGAASSRGRTLKRCLRTWWCDRMRTRRRTRVHGLCGAAAIPRATTGSA